MTIVRSPAELTEGDVCEALLRVGLSLSPREIVSIERRDHRWLVRLPNDRLAWFAVDPKDEKTRARFRNERRVLRLLEERCKAFKAPRVTIEHETVDEAFDVRTMVPGTVDPGRIYTLACEDTRIAKCLGEQIGAILAEQHTRVVAADVTAWLPKGVGFPEPIASIAERLPTVIADDASLITDACGVIDRYETLMASTADEDRVLVHGDVGFHNLAIDINDDDATLSIEGEGSRGAPGAPGVVAPVTVRGIFDYDDPAFADRHLDFRYLVFDSDRFDLLDAACRVYEPITGRSISRDHVLLHNAAAAVAFLAYRAGFAPDEKPCGRTLAQDLAWTRHAIARVRL